MRAVRLLAFSFVVVLLTAFVAAPAYAVAPPGYAALGDSYSSGLGAGSSYGGGSCELSSGSFPALWSAAHATVPFKQLACAGATTADVAGTQANDIPPNTGLVSVTAGGNDVGFSTIMTTCALWGTSACVSAVNAGEDVARNKLPALLDTAYNAIRANALNANVVVLSYPQFYQLNVFFCIGLSSVSRAKIDEGISIVDKSIQAAASRHRFTFADVQRAFVGHQLCSGDKWLHAVDLADIQESYHPTAAGQSQGYLPVFTTAVANHPAASPLVRG
jgi:hypothetical protein